MNITLCISYTSIKIKRTEIDFALGDFTTYWFLHYVSGLVPGTLYVISFTIILPATLLDGGRYHHSTEK